MGGRICCSMGIWEEGIGTGDGGERGIQWKKRCGRKRKKEGGYISLISYTKLEQSLDNRKTIFTFTNTHVSTVHVLTRKHQYWLQSLVR